MEAQTEENLSPSPPSTNAETEEAPAPTPEPFLLESICANCSVALSVDDFVAVFTLPGEMNEQRSVHQVIELIFRGHEAAEAHPNALKFCSSCGSIFQKILHSYMNFLCATSMGSYIYNLRHGVKLETEEAKTIEESQADMSHFECLSISLNDNPTLKQEVTSGSSSRTKRMSTRIRRTTAYYNPIETKKRRKSNNSSASLVKRKRLSAGVTTAANDESTTQSNEADMEDTANSPAGSMSDSFDQDDEEEDPPSPPSLRPRRGRKKRLAIQATRKICKICNAKVPTGVTMSEHKQTHFDYPFTCGDCGMKFRVRSSYNSHVNTKSHRKNYVTQRRELDLTKRNSGIAEHSEELKALLVITDFKCNAAGCIENTISFPTLKEWIIHQEGIHGVQTGYTNVEEMADDSKPKSGCLRPCSQCGRKFKNNESMIVHLKCIHLKLRPFSCDICGKKSSSKENAQSHRRIHDTKKDRDGNEDVQRNFLCTLCGSTFKVKASLDIHEKTHMNLVVMKYECDICHQKFITPSRRREHVATAHSEDRAFSCDQCNQSFKAKRTLDRHRLRQHIKQFNRDEICELCGKGFRNKTHLKEHLMSVHKLEKERARISAKIKPALVFRILPDGTRVYPEKTVKPKTCQICNRTYVRREQLFTHLISVHGKTEEESKEITGLESKRNLLPGGNSSRRKKQQQQQQQLQQSEQPLQFYQL